VVDRRGHADPPPDETGSREEDGIKLRRFEALVSALTAAQHAAIAAVLRAFAATDEEGSLGERARAALEHHWNTYLPGGS